MKKAVIFLNGKISGLKKVLDYVSNTDFVICANGGTRYAFKFGLTPHVIIGDHDSLTPKLDKELKGHPIAWIRYPQDKDQTDSELAIDYAVNKGFKEILIFGAFGGSLIDHTYANLLLASHPKYKKVNIAFIHGNQEIFIVKKERVIKGKKGNLLSLIPLKGNCLGVVTQGLKWQLKDSVLYYGSTLGISNILTSRQAEIKIRKGILLVVHTRV